MLKDELPAVARKHLFSLLDEPGGLLYSSHETLRPGPVYLLGYNPGGVGGPALKHSINSLLQRTENAYLEEAWENANGSFEPGTAPLQKNIQWVLAQMGQDTADVCASNLIFLQSREASGVPACLANQCWPVHDAILSIVKPSVIVTNGNGPVSAYSHLKATLGAHHEDIQSAQHGHFALKRFHTRHQGRPVVIAGLPHLSRYHPQRKPEVAQWLADLLPQALKQIVEV